MLRRNLLKFLPLPFLPLNWGRAAELADNDPAILLESQNTRPAPPSRCCPTQDGPPQFGRANTWIVGESWLELKRESLKNFCWTFVGVFDSEESAIEACKSECHFVGPAVINEAIDEEGLETCWQGIWYPLSEKNPRFSPSVYVAPLKWVKANEGDITRFLQGYTRSWGKRLLGDMEFAQFITMQNGKIIILSKGQDYLGKYESRMKKSNWEDLEPQKHFDYEAT